MGDRRPRHRHLQLIGLELQEQVKGRRPTVDPKLRERPPAGRRHGLDDRTGLVRHGLHHRPRQMGPSCPPGDPDQGAPGVGIPPRASQAGEGRHQVQPVGVGDAAGQRAGLGRVGDDTQAVPEPLDGRARHEDGSLQCVRRRGGVLEDPCNAREQPFHRVGALLADVHEHEASRAIGVLGHSRGEAGVAEERRRLVTGDPRDGHPGRQRRGARCGQAEPTARRPHLGEPGGSDVEELGQLVVPAPAADVEQQSAAGVGRVRGVNRPSGQLPQQPGVHRADGQLRVAAKARAPGPGPLPAAAGLVSHSSLVAEK